MMEPVSNGLVARTLTAFTHEDHATIDQLVDGEWGDYSLASVLAALAELALKLPALTGFGLTPSSVMIVNTRTGESDIELAPPGIRAGARLLTAGMNADALAVSDIVQAFVHECCADDEQASEQTALMFTTVFSGAAGMVAAAAHQLAPRYDNSQN